MKIETTEHTMTGTGGGHDAAPSGAGAGTRDQFLDTIRAVALARVVAWHTWSWAPLSWFAAMPAMFFVAGSLLERSLDRRRASVVLRSRLRRLLLPFWVYGAVAVTVMCLDGWQPTASELLSWILPISDPVGAASMPELWIPLWYVRAYVWLLLAAPALRWLVMRVGTPLLAVPIAATVAVFAVERGGVTVPLAVSDAAVYGTFALAGMLVSRGALRLDPRNGRRVAVAAAIAAVLWAIVFWPPDGIVNASAPLLLAVGAATLGVLGMLRAPLSRPSPRIAAVIDGINARALTIYLWHGFGLLAANRLVRPLDLAWPIEALLSIVVVVATTALLTLAFGSVEHHASGRPAPSGFRRRAVTSLVALIVAMSVLTLAVVPEQAPHAAVFVPPSGRAVAARGALVDAEAARASEPKPPAPRAALDRAALTTAFDTWVFSHGAELDSAGTSRLEVAVVDGAGELATLSWQRSPSVTMGSATAWWSMSKTATVVWGMRLEEAGVLSFDDRLSDYVPEMPFAHEITLADLAGHRSGIPPSTDGDISTTTPAQDIGRALALPALATEPGTTFAYSRTGYLLLTWALERASGTTWRAAMDALALEAGVHLAYDEDVDPQPASTHPEGGSYHGRLWGSGGLRGTVVDGAHFYRWLLTTAIGPASVRAMATFPDPAERTPYGLGVMAACPCWHTRSGMRSTRIGLDAVWGAYNVDVQTGSAVMFGTDSWIVADERVPAAFYALMEDLLDIAGGVPASRGVGSR